VTAHSTRPSRPKKPRTDFPLFPHANGYWAKKVRQKLHYFGKWADDPKGEAAGLLWAEQKDDLFAGRVPRSKRDELTVAELANRFLASKEALVETGELKQRTWKDYFIVCERVLKVFGRSRVVSDLSADDFAKLRVSFAKTHGPYALSGDITRARSLFKWGFDEALIATPIRFGQSFNKPSRKTLRLTKAAGGARMFERAEVLAVLKGKTLKDKSKAKGATQPMKTMILLAINGGLGNSDVASLPISAIDLKGGWIDYPRPKTGIPRRIPLWPETKKALTEVLKSRPKPRDIENADRLFLTVKGNTWERTEVNGDPISKEFTKLLKRLELHQPGLSFYSLRRTFRTIASEACDEPAADAIMGHAPGSDDMAAVYRQRVDDDRLQAVVKHVRKWLFAKGGA
jgi:integrase